MRACKLDRLDSVARAHGVVAVCLQQVVEELHIKLVVFHDQHGFSQSQIPSLPQCPGCADRCARNQQLTGTIVRIPYRNGNSCELKEWVKHSGQAPGDLSDLVKTLLIRL